ncbi:MAG TPA: PFL family protein [Myxococcota bacterium]|jgi:hypothetical protein|nr:PFL family protein [Myxococcota bacterium]
MLWQHHEVLETLRMIESEHLDIRTVTLGVSLRDCASPSMRDCCARVGDKIRRVADRLVAVAAAVQQEVGIPITNKRVAVTPIAQVAEPSFAAEGADPAELCHVLDAAAADVGIDYIAGYSALVHKGATPGETALIDSIPEAIGGTRRVCASVNIATTRTGINLNAARRMGEVILRLAARTAAEGGIGCAKLVVFANAVEDNPFVAGAFHGAGEPDLSLNVGVSGPGVVCAAVERLMAERDRRPIDVGTVAETIKRMAYKVTRAGELVGREVALRLGADVRFGIVDLSLAPTPAIGDSVAEILEAMGLERVGAPGTTAALALLTDAVKKGGVMASSSVGGLSGAFIPVSEDAGMVAAVEAGALTLEKLEAMTSVCSVGLDMVAVPGDTPATTIAGILADEAAIGVMNNKTTAVRIIPVPGKVAGDKVVFGGLLGEAPVMPVSRFRSDGFVNLGGRIPAPITSVRN